MPSLPSPRFWQGCYGTGSLMRKPRFLGQAPANKRAGFYLRPPLGRRSSPGVFTADACCSTVPVLILAPDTEPCPADPSDPPTANLDCRDSPRPKKQGQPPPPGLADPREPFPSSWDPAPQPSPTSPGVFKPAKIPRRALKHIFLPKSYKWKGSGAVNAQRAGKGHPTAQPAAGGVWGGTQPWGPHGTG